MKPRLDHIGLDVSDYERSKAFYEKALAPLGIEADDGAGSGRRGIWRRASPSSGSPSASGAGQRRARGVHGRGSRDRRCLPRRRARGRRARTTAGRACARSTTPTTTAPSCSTPTATTSRPSATPPLSRGAVGARRLRDRAVVDPAVRERRHDRPLAAPGRHLGRREHVQPARVARVRVRDRLLLHHRVVLVDRVLEGVGVHDHLAVEELRVLPDPRDLRLVRVPGVGAHAVLGA